MNVLQPWIVYITITSRYSCPISVILTNRLRDVHIFMVHKLVALVACVVSSAVHIGKIEENSRIREFWRITAINWNQRYRFEKICWKLMSVFQCNNSIICVAVVVTVSQLEY